MKNFLIIILTLAGFSTSFAQGNIFGFGYNIGLPTLGQQDFSSENSYRGFSFEYQKEIMDNLYVGGEGGWSVFHEVFPRQTYEFDGGAVNIKQWRYTHMVPVLATARYMLYNTDRLDIYSGVGLGVTYVNQEVWAGLLEYVEDGWKFSIAPEMGMIVNVAGTFGLLFNARYNFIAKGHVFQDDNSGVMQFRFGFVIAN